MTVENDKNGKKAIAVSGLAEVMTGEHFAQSLAPCETSVSVPPATAQLLVFPPSSGTSRG